MPKEHTAAKGLLTKVNTEGCRSCAEMVYLPPQNASKIGREAGWHRLAELQQKSQEIVEWTLLFA